MNPKSSLSKAKANTMAVKTEVISDESHDFSLSIKRQDISQDQNVFG
jgi:hypothetical protein